MTPTPRLSCADCDNKGRLVHLYPVGNPPSRSHPVNLAIEAEAAPPDALREALRALVEAVQVDAGTFPWNPNIEVALEQARAALAIAQPTESCSGCHGRRWTEDENWQPDDPVTWHGERTHRNGLIPCGFCNHGGWTTPDYEPAAAQPAEDEL